MHAEAHHFRNVILAILLALIALMLLARPAHSVWSADSAQVYAMAAAAVEP